METFYCGNCGKHKKIEALCLTRKPPKKKMCIACNEKAEKQVERSGRHESNKSRSM